ncbi:MAG: FMN-binding protein [Gammaproteobacteria bacterium]|nr:FMN-binding protein [Gammaproteobacteria bacterium]
MSSADNITKPEASSSTLVLALALAGFISGIAIITVFEATLPTITANKARELRRAVFQVLPGVTQMQPVLYAEGQLTYAPEAKASPDLLYAGYDEKGSFVGYAIPSAGPGFQDTISLLYGYQPDSKRVVGMEILESRETPGLGDKIYKDAEFVANFDNLSADPQIDTVKKGRKSAPNEIDAITGATISSKAVARIINEAHQRWREELPPPGNEPPLEQLPGKVDEK